MRVKLFFVFIVFCCLAEFIFAETAYHVQRIDSRAGLSNSAVLSMFQDNKGYMWVGTYNGLNRYDGKFIESYGLDESINNMQSSNIIHNIQYAGDNCLWLSTYIGFNKFSMSQNRVVEHYPKYGYPFNLASNGSDLTCLIAKKGFLSVYNRKKKDFEDVDFTELDPNEILTSFFDKDNYLWIVTSTNKIWKVQINIKSAGNVTETVLGKFTLDFIPDTKSLIFAIEDNGMLHIVTKSGELYSYDIERKKNNYIHNIEKLVAKYGVISSIVNFHDDLWISFKGSGTLKLVTAKKYNEEIIDLSTGVFCLRKDKNQDIMWVGSDGQGVHVYGIKTSIFNTILTADLPIPIKKPIRSIYTDKNNTLWIGTKGDGLIMIADYDRFADQKVPKANVKQFTTSDGLASNQIFAIRKSDYHDVVWLCSGGPGLSYYSNTSHRILTIPNPTTTVIRAVHALAEQNDSTLWLATSTFGLLKVKIKSIQGKIEIVSIKTIIFNRVKKPVNDLFSLHIDKNGYLWIGSRGDGVIKLRLKDEQYEFVTSGKTYNTPIDDILSICKSCNSNFYFGSCAGLLKLSTDSLSEKLTEIPNKTKTGMREMIHGLQEDKTGCLWMSTNRGLEKYNPKNNIFHKYVKYTGLNVIEFSDNADYKCNFSNRIFFGGIDGIVWIEQNIPDHKLFSPEINFVYIKSNGVKENLSKYIKYNKQGDYLELEAEQNSFDISFVAIDFVRGANIEYLYKLENYHNDWYNANELNEARFNSLPPGKYELKVKYKYDVFDEESEFYVLPIVILSPWYLTDSAIVAYLVLLIASVFFLIRYLQRNAEFKRKEFNQHIIERNKDELYQAKMKFFTNITHEFLTPLTLIQGPCERIIEYSNSDDYIKKYATLLRLNSERLQLLIHEIINFSKREEFGSQVCKIETVQLSENLKAIRLAFEESAERNHVDFQFDVPEKLIWNTDISCLNKIMMNLLSNAFKYTPRNGKIKVQVGIENSELLISVYNTGKGIASDELTKVFDRFKILDNMEDNSYMDFSSRNGLGLAICYSMIRLLKGEVDVKSELGSFAEFIVRLPKQDSNETSKAGVGPSLLNYPEGDMKNDDDQQIGRLDNRSKLLVVDDNKDIVWMVSELMHDKFDIIKAYNAQEALDILENELPELIVADLMMPGELDGSDLVKQLKSNKFTAQVPIIVISAKNTMEDQIAGLEFGADFYLTKPFNLSYLRTTIEKLIEKKSAVKEFYNSPLSAIELKDGHIMHHEDQHFLMSVKQIIDVNMIHGELRPELIAEQLKMNHQAFYRKIKSVSSLSPSDFIKHYRFSVAAKLLLSSNLSVKEISFRVGINNRSYFYRQFYKLYNATPKEYRLLSNPEDD